MNRRKFVSISSFGCLAFTSGCITRVKGNKGVSFQDYIMTVNGKLFPKDIGFVLPHEHIVTDFIGAERVKQPQYRRTDVFNKVKPVLEGAKQRGVGLIVECTPAYIGRDVELLQQLSKDSGIHMVTNTGYYAASNFKFLPQHAYVESSSQLAARWVKEWEDGIEGTGIRPGFIKLGVNNGPLQAVEVKIIEAAALTHLKSGLKIGIHTGDVKAVYEELNILDRNGVAPDALIWIHAQNDQDGEAQIRMAKKGVWISLDGVNEKEGAILQYCATIKRFKREGLLSKLLVSHDDGFAVNIDGSKILLSPYDNGNVKLYSSIFEKLKPALIEEGLTESDFAMLTVNNGIEAFKIKIFSRKMG